MDLIKPEKLNRELSEPFAYRFMIEKKGWYLIEITASAQSWWQNLKQRRSFFQDDDLTVKIDTTAFPKLSGKRGLFDGEVAWNGNNLKGLTKTVVLVCHLADGGHYLQFLVAGRPRLESIAVRKVKNLEEVVYTPQENNPAQDGERRQWLTIVIVNAPLATLILTAQAGMRGSDDDDVKLVVNGKTELNLEPKAHRYWYWCGRTLHGREKTLNKDFNLPVGLHYLELWADKTPLLGKIGIVFGGAQKHWQEGYNDPVETADGFNENYVLKDAAFNNKKVMDEPDIQFFLESRGAAKGKRHIAWMEFNGHKAAYWIKKAAEEYGINPRILLTKLQAEQQLIKGSKSQDPTEQQLNGAMGLGMLDDGTVIKELQGFIKQITRAAEYFREYYNQAEADHFTHKNVDGKELRAVNAATYSLYKYTPHLAGARLFYDVYEGFFGVDDLGGFPEQGSSDYLRTILITAATVILPLLLYLFLVRGGEPAYLWQNNVSLGNGLALISELKIFSQKEAAEEDGLYCGFRLGKIYEASARLLLTRRGKVLESIEATDPELVLPNLSERYLMFYKPFDIDGDGQKQEFVVRNYGACNGDIFSFIRVDKRRGRFEKIPVVHRGGRENFVLYGGLGNNGFAASRGMVAIQYYDNSVAPGASGSFEDWYIYNKINNKLEWFKQERL